MDKVKHIFVGLTLSLLVGFLFCPIVGLIAAIVAGAWKEWRDKRTGRGTPELLDFVATVVGGLVGYVILALI